MTRLFLLAGAAILAISTQVQAAPQPLGLVMTIDPAPLHCERGKCAAVLTSFCLQQSRLPPGPGDEYLLAPGAELRLVVTRADGGTVALDGAALLKFVSRAGFSTTNAEIDRDALVKAAGGEWKDAQIEVGERATLLPIAVAGDPKPLTENEIAMAMGPWRAQAEALFDKPNPRSDANRIIARAISVLPEDWKSDGMPAHDTAWNAALAAPGRGFTEDGVALGRRMFAACKNTVAQSLKWALRNCLERRLDEQQREINQEYWDQQSGV